MPAHGAATDGATAANSGKYPELAGRSAVVAGAARGTGLGIVRALAAQRVNILLNSFGNPTESERIRVGLSREYGVAAACIPADLRDPRGASILAVLAMNAFGHIDILVNNVGVQDATPLETLPPDLLDTAAAANLSAAFHLTWTVIDGMREQGWGRIINVAPMHGLIELTKAVADEGAGHGITCNAICPRRVSTPPAGGQTCGRGIGKDAVVRHALLARYLDKHVVAVEELGAFTAFLCSNAAASITGAAFAVNGCP